MLSQGTVKFTRDRRGNLHSYWLDHDGKAREFYTKGASAWPLWRRAIRMGEIRRCPSLDTNNSRRDAIEAKRAMKTFNRMSTDLPTEVNGVFIGAEAAQIAMPVQADQWDESVRGKKMSDTTGRVIFKYQMPVLERFTMKLPAGAEIVRMCDQGGMFWLWAVVRTDVPDEERTFRAFKCGGKIPDDLNLRYVGFCAVFVQMELGLYIFEEIANA